MTCGVTFNSDVTEDATDCQHWITNFLGEVWIQETKLCLSVLIEPQCVERRCVTATRFATKRTENSWFYKSAVFPTKSKAVLMRLYCVFTPRRWQWVVTVATRTVTCSALSMRSRTARFSNPRSLAISADTKAKFPSTDFFNHVRVS